MQGGGARRRGRNSGRSLAGGRGVRAGATACCVCMRVFATQLCVCALVCVCLRRASSPTTATSAAPPRPASRGTLLMARSLPSSAARAPDSWVSARAPSRCAPVSEPSRAAALLTGGRPYGTASVVACYLRNLVFAPFERAALCALCIRVYAGGDTKSDTICRRGCRGRDNGDGGGPCVRSREGEGHAPARVRPVRGRRC